MINSASSKLKHSLLGSAPPQVQQQL